MNVLLEKSLINCHCFGMDSLVIKDGPGMVRMFIARKDHFLYRNEIGREDSYYQFSVGLHRHHCDITLMPLFGNISNITFANRYTDKEQRFLRQVSPFKYESPISGGHGSFQKMDGPITAALTYERIKGPTHMSAERAHTVHVPYGETAAWLVWEGAENPDHQSITYSDDDLTKFDFSQTNLPMTPERLTENLALLNVRI